MNRNGKRLMAAAIGLNAIRAVRSTLLMIVIGQATRKLTIKLKQRTQRPILIVMDRQTSLVLRLLEHQRTHVILKTVK